MIDRRQAVKEVCAEGSLCTQVLEAAFTVCTGLRLALPDLQTRRGFSAQAVSIGKPHTKWMET